MVLRTEWGPTGFGRMHTLTGGPPAAPHVVLVHGAGMSAEYLAPLAEDLATRYHVHVPELPGFGQSDKPSRVLDMRELTAALAQWADAAGVRHAAWMGNSMGCQLVACLGVDRPDLVAAAILQGPTVLERVGGPWSVLWRGLPLLFADVPFERWSVLPIAWRAYFRAGPLRTMRTMRAALRDPIAAHLLRLTVPTMILRGSRDTLVPEEWASRMAGRMRDARHVTLEGAPHGAVYSAREAVLAEALPFLARVLGDTPRAAETA